MLIYIEVNVISRQNVNNIVLNNKQYFNIKFFFFRFLTFCYLAAFNLWLILCPATLSHDWQMGSVPLVTSMSDSRNFLTCFSFGLVFLLALRSILDFEVNQPAQARFSFHPNPA